MTRASPSPSPCWQLALRTTGHERSAEPLLDRLRVSRAGTEEVHGQELWALGDVVAVGPSLAAGAADGRERQSLDPEVVAPAACSIGERNRQTVARTGAECQRRGPNPARIRRAGVDERLEPRARRDIDCHHVEPAHVA